MWPGPEYTDEYVLNTLHQYPNLILWMAGTSACECGDAATRSARRPTLAFWEVETCSLRDHPQQFRTFDIRRNSDNTVSIIITDVDPAVSPTRRPTSRAGMHWARSGSLAPRPQSSPTPHRTLTTPSSSYN
jgi:hypothetical protein